MAIATVLIQTEQATMKGERTPARGLNQRLGVGVDGRYRRLILEISLHVLTK